MGLVVVAAAVRVTNSQQRDSPATMGIAAEHPHFQSTLNGDL
jgi:hypothetical protein